MNLTEYTLPTVDLFFLYCRIGIISIGTSFILYNFIKRIPFASKRALECFLFFKNMNFIVYFFKNISDPNVFSRHNPPICQYRKLSPRIFYYLFKYNIITTVEVFDLIIANMESYDFLNIFIKNRKPRSLIRLINKAKKQEDGIQKTLIFLYITYLLYNFNDLDINYLSNLIKNCLTLDFKYEKELGRMRPSNIRFRLMRTLKLSTKEQKILFKYFSHKRIFNFLNADKNVVGNINALLNLLKTLGRLKNSDLEKMNFKQKKIHFLTNEARTLYNIRYEGKHFFMTKEIKAYLKYNNIQVFNYLIKVPKNLNQISTWGFLLSNCLASYKNSIIERGNMVLGIYNKDKLIGALEIDSYGNIVHLEFTKRSSHSIEYSETEDIRQFLTKELKRIAEE